MKKNVLNLLFLTLLFSDNAFSISYEATAMSKTNNLTSSSKVFVKDNKVRIEYAANDEKFIQISNPSKKRSWVLLEKDKTYIESKTSMDLLPKSLKINLKKLCKPKNIKCFKGKEKWINGKKTREWKIELYKNKSKTVSYLWVDSVSGIPIKQKYADGSYTELKFIKNELVNNRKTQKWQLTLVNRLKQKIHVYQWFDPKLNLTIKELYPDNSVKELKNIKIKKLKDSLFTLPKGYVKNTQLNN